MGMSAAIALATVAVTQMLTPKPPSIPSVPKPPGLSDAEKQKAESDAVALQRAQAMAASGGGNNILTSPLGLVGNPMTTTPTLLGG